MTRSCLMIVLAAGEGTRMKSAIPKVLHEIGGRPMVGHVIAAAQAAGADRIAVVVGPRMEAVAAAVAKAAPGAQVFVQEQRLGTGHAVLQARKAIEAGADDVVVLYGDTPLVTPETLLAVRARLAAGTDVVVLGFRTPKPAGYGRLLTKNDRLVAIREDKDASETERAVTLCNSGIMGFRGLKALQLLDRVGNANAKGEYYLTDAVEIAVAQGLSAAVVEGDEPEFQGVNDRAQLARAEAVFQDRRRRAAMAAGVTLTAPETVFFSHDTVLGQDVVIEPNVVFGPGVTVEAGARIRAFSHLEGARVGAAAIVGPYSRLRPGADIGPEAHIGNFVEIKNATVEAGAKANHLAYIGDARVGAKANIGAGTITCNYDGFGKYRTDIGANAFVGSNSSLVAPVRIGAGAYVGSGSVVTADVPADGLAIGRGRQVVREGWARAFREKMKAFRK
ncbi:bifunctional UDP-N-acetylglucosamine diphosphorylase/glucosamine-1-phosphate N-acetyltransferase GlmU [Prosthecomicrobium sp. N25]|uniref:bifunctional UDP-N-acetylglucosamine diphosphorylase/glucosamine-1-phosphate N-acetyltransferase GlmU n=1 Tax=Prosthecomicrobium sp. N25 TaxID=3129254 RepID=UPI003078297F